MIESLVDCSLILYIKITNQAQENALIERAQSSPKPLYYRPEFLRVAVYRQAEVDSMLEVPKFIDKAQSVYRYPHFINDVGGSVCELDEPGVIESLVDCSLILYIKITNQAQENALIERAQSSPKPLYYRPEFLREQLQIYLKQEEIEYAAQIDPDEFARWIFPRLFHSRLPRYDAIAEHGYTVTSDEAARVENEDDLLQLLELAIERQN